MAFTLSCWKRASSFSVRVLLAKGGPACWHMAALGLLLAGIHTVHALTLHPGSQAHLLRWDGVHAEPLEADVWVPRMAGRGCNLSSACVWPCWPGKLQHVGCVRLPWSCWSQGNGLKGVQLPLLGRLRRQDGSSVR